MLMYKSSMLWASQINHKYENQMRQIILILLLISCAHQLAAQAKHEIKFSPISLRFLEMVPSYEIISKNEKIGFEIGVGYNFGKARLTTSNDTMFNFFAEDEKYDQRTFKSVMSLRFYKSRQMSDYGIAFFVGPFARYEQRTFLEDAYLVRQDELIVISSWHNEEFIGQREIVTGLLGGFKFLFHPKRFVELGYEIGVIFNENMPDSLEYKEAFTFGRLHFKAGYRFGNRPMPSKVVE